MPRPRFLHFFVKTAAATAAALLFGAAAHAAPPLAAQVDYVYQLTEQKALQTCAVNRIDDHNGRILRFLCGRKALYVCNGAKPVSTTHPEGMRDCIIMRARRYD